MKAIIPGDSKRSAELLCRIEMETENMVSTARSLAEQMRQALPGKDKERQLRNIQGVAEQSTSWAEVELFIRYQAARKEIPIEWAQSAIETLSGLEEVAKRIASGEPPEVIRRIHLELIRRVLGYTVRWHVFHVKGEPLRSGGR